MDDASATEAWLAAAVTYWVGRALQRAATHSPLAPWQIAGEVKQWGADRLPPGIDGKAYSKCVVARLKADPRLVYCTDEGGVWRSADPGAAATSRRDAAPEVQAATEAWVAHIRFRAAVGNKLTVAELRDAIEQRAPEGGYFRASTLVAPTTFFNAVQSRLLSDPRVFCALEKDASGALRKVYSPAEPQVAPVTFGGSNCFGAAVAPPPTPPPRRAREADAHSTLRPLRCATVDAAELHACATYAEVSGLLLSDDDADEDGRGASFDEEAALADYFSGRGAHGSDALSRGYSLADGARSGAFEEASLLGHLRCAEHGGAHDGAPVFLNTHEPFCFVAVGVQGGGKSHSLACVLEACLLPFPRGGVVRLRAPMSALALHYDASATAVCEATGLASPAPALRRLLGAAGAPALPRDRLVVLVSPSFYTQRAAFYGDYCTVRPLLLRWASLSAEQLKRIMRVREGDAQLYVAALLDLLRRYQRAGRVPDFAQFTREVAAACNVTGQAAPLQQRLALLESLVAESALNAPLRHAGGDVASCCAPGTLVVVDLTDPLLSAEEANGVFTVLVEAFRATPARRAGKLLVLDEAHKYMSGAAADGLSAAVVACARLMRHDGLRLAVSTQSPSALAPELLELVSVALLHRFHSADWLAHLGKKLPLAGAAVWRRLVDLEPGRALLFAARHLLPPGAALGGAEEHGGGHVFELAVRPRLTADRGASRTNAGAPTREPALDAAT